MDNDAAPASPYAGLAQKIRGGPSAVAEEYANRLPVIHIVRPLEDWRLRGRWALIDLFRMVLLRYDFDVLLDDQQVGRLARSSELRLEISAGRHVLQVKTPLVKSRRLAFEIANGQRFRFTCQTSIAGLVLQKH